MKAWVHAAASLPIAFSQVREDPRIDLALCASLDNNSTVVMVASGGDTAVCLGRLALGQLILVDMNPAQLALARCKRELAKGSRKAALEWLGHAPLPLDERRQRVEDTLTALALPTQILGPLIERGPDQAGRYELVFAALRQALEPVLPQLERFLSGPAGPIEASLDRAIEAAFEEVMALENLVAIFGSQATQNPQRSFASHFAARTRVAALRFAPVSNPFLWQILAGRFPPNVTWDWLEPDSWGQSCLEFDCREARMLEALAAMRAESADLVHLSNILDWLSEVEATQLLTHAHRVLKPGGRLILRQLNSSLDISGLPTELHWDLAAGARLEANDRSFFYPRLHLGRRQ